MSRIVSASIFVCVANARNDSRSRSSKSTRTWISFVKKNWERVNGDEDDGDDDGVLVGMMTGERLGWNNS